LFYEQAWEGMRMLVKMQALFFSTATFSPRIDLKKEA
jgi:hypothetical protein